MVASTGSLLAVAGEAGLVGSAACTYVESTLVAAIAVYWEGVLGRPVGGAPWLVDVLFEKGGCVGSGTSKESVGFLKTVSRMKSGLFENLVAIPHQRIGLITEACYRGGCRSVTNDSLKTKAVIVKESVHFELAKVGLKSIFTCRVSSFGVRGLCIWEPDLLV
ncbi:hypothetical protein Tco_1476726 [Tanacetum coccineum]